MPEDEATVLAATLEMRSELVDVRDHYHHVMVLSTAQSHGRGIHRLPDRVDRSHRVAAVQVETDSQARVLCAFLDRRGRYLYLDVERKQDLNLMRVAGEVLTVAEAMPTKPNDTTVDAMQALVLHHYGPQLDGLPVGVVGTGNLGFKFALRLVEAGCRVTLFGRDTRKARMLAGAIDTIVPRHTPHQVACAEQTDSAPVSCLLSALSAEHALGISWIEVLTGQALCVDVGINNFSPEFIEAAHGHGHTCVRLDVRSAGNPLPVVPNPFFAEIAGRTVMGGVSVVAGGTIGYRHEVVVDELSHPRRVIGVANGTGGLLPTSEWDDDVRRSVSALETLVSNNRRTWP